MSTATDGVIEAGDRRAPRTAGQQRRGGMLSVAPAPNRSVPADGPEPWRFVLIVGGTPDGTPTPFVLNRVTSCVLGSGACVLEEPFGPMVRIRFDRCAPTMAEAVAAAVREVEAVGLGVLRVDNDDWVTAADIAHRVGRSREAVRLWASGQNGPGGFPLPVNPRREITFYSWAEMLPWLRDRLGLDLPDEDPTLVAANLAVRLRALLPGVQCPQAILDLINPSGAALRAAGVT